MRPTKNSSKPPSISNDYIFLNTKGACLLCSENCAPSPSEEKRHADLQTSINFCRLTSRYLGFNLENVVASSLTTVGKKGVDEDAKRPQKIAIELCARCLTMAHAFCQVHFQLQFHQMLLDRCVRSLTEVIRDSAKKETEAMFPLSKDGRALRKQQKTFTRLTAGSFKSASNLRNKLYKKSLAKLSSAFPVIRMKRICKSGDWIKIIKDNKKSDFMNKPNKQCTPAVPQNADKNAVFFASLLGCIVSFWVVLSLSFINTDELIKSSKSSQQQQDQSQQIRSLRRRTISTSTNTISTKGDELVIQVQLKSKPTPDIHAKQSLLPSMPSVAQKIPPAQVQIQPCEKDKPVQTSKTRSQVSTRKAEAELLQNVQLCSNPPANPEKPKQDPPKVEPIPSKTLISSVAVPVTTPTSANLPQQSQPRQHSSHHTYQSGNYPGAVVAAQSQAPGMAQPQTWHSSNQHQYQPYYHSNSLQSHQQQQPPLASSSAYNSAGYPSASSSQQQSSVAAAASHFASNHSQHYNYNSTGNTGNNYNYNYNFTAYNYNGASSWSSYPSHSTTGYSAPPSQAAPLHASGTSSAGAPSASSWSGGYNSNEEAYPNSRHAAGSNYNYAGTGWTSANYDYTNTSGYSYHHHNQYNVASQQQQQSANYASSQYSHDPPESNDEKQYADISNSKRSDFVEPPQSLELPPYDGAPMEMDNANDNSSHPSSTKEPSLTYDEEPQLMDLELDEQLKNSQNKDTDGVTPLERVSLSPTSAVMFPEIHWRQSGATGPRIPCTHSGCTEQFLTQAQLQLHSRAHGSFQCHFCQIMFGKAHRLAMHEKLDHGSTQGSGSTGRIKCPRCDYSSTSQFKYLIHFIGDHLQIPVHEKPCDICNKPFVFGTKVINRRNHFKSYHDVEGKDPDDIFTCKDCGAPFLKEAQYKDHQTHCFPPPASTPASCSSFEAEITYNTAVATADQIVFP